MIDAESLLETLEFSYDGIWITDGEGRVLFANSANAALLGVSKAELEGKTTQQLLEEKVFSNSVILEAIARKRQTSKISYNYRTRLTVLATATPLLDDSGRVRLVINNVRDITDLNQLQQNLQQQEQIIEQQNEQLENMRIRLGEGTIIANSKAFREVVALAQRVAHFDGATALILGESGTGKELIAELIVNHSPRKDKPYLQVNCGAIPENLIESELFGYEKGAFTGAVKNKPGMFELANGGTLLLDEIGELPKALQPKLLRVLQEREIMRVGGTKTIPVDVRLIAATNQDLVEMVRRGEFRQDLYYRLNLIPLRIPPLRERAEDIPLLVQHFLDEFNGKYGKKKRVTDTAMQTLKLYQWPGNIRELENLLERLVIIGDETRITSSQISKILTVPDRALSTGLEDAGLSLKERMESYERELLQEALSRCGTTYKAAQALRISQPTVARKAKQYGLKW